ncbi:hypothetical protein HN748_01855 [Candidatus Peregrinibacteria bacterium]|jgi:hypothetical protein|nr:hypothetical protein [Candidatus Peregrinibacteria bacterium]MBT7702955.1 hypothetical protein [Candidatus Peregrinibacteria bacterium]
MSTEPPVSFNPTNISTVNLNLKEVVEKLLLVLSEKEKYIIKHRFSIGTESRKTLEAIGKHYGVTRERIRQIEKNALKKLKRNAFNTNLKIVNELGKSIIKKHGGLLIEKKLVSIILSTLKNVSPTEANEIKLSLALDPDIAKASNTLDFEPHWRFNTVNLPLVRKISTLGFNVLNKKGNVLPVETITNLVLKEIGEEVPESLIISVSEIDKRTKFVKEGIGLKDWRHINPRTLRDKINFILEREHKPLHFVDIANKIRDSKFDHKNINVQAVHNELIRNNHFVLIGRGIYALDKWGYQPGTVGDVIAAILKDGKPRSREEIMKEVLKQRQVKKITIYLNLKNDARIKSLEGDRYALTK